jgi:hypothetical protein
MVIVLSVLYSLLIDRVVDYYGGKNDFFLSGVLCVNITQYLTIL